MWGRQEWTKRPAGLEECLAVPCRSDRWTGGQDGGSADLPGAREGVVTDGLTWSKARTHWGSWSVCRAACARFSQVLQSSRLYLTASLSAVNASLHTPRSDSGLEGG